jgi:hypothetical protein
MKGVRFAAALAAAASLLGFAPQDAGRSAAPSAALGSSAGASDPRFFPVEQAVAGTAAVARTVFRGDQIEEFPLEIIGRFRNFAGPGQDVILAKLLGDKTSFTGVSGGMRGSPVYVDGKLLGALSYRIGNFSKEPIAGITPIADMLRAAEFPKEAPAAGRWLPSSRPRLPRSTTPGAGSRALGSDRPDRHACLPRRLQRRDRDRFARAWEPGLGPRGPLREPGCGLRAGSRRVLPPGERGGAGNGARARR